MLNQLPDLNRLGVFYQVIEAGSAIQAAAKLHVTPSAVSQAIKHLEEELHEQLFIRKGGKLIPTGFSYQLYETLKPLMNSLIRHTEIRSFRNEISGIIKIISPTLFSETVLIPIIGRFITQYPLVRFQIITAALANISEFLERDQADFGLIDSASIFLGKKTFFIHHLLKEEAEFLTCSKMFYNSVLKRNDSYSNIIASNFICYDSTGTDARELLRSVFRKKPDRINPRLCVNTVYEMLSAIKSNLGIGILPKELIQDELSGGRLIAIGKAGFTNQISLVAIRNKKMSPQAKKFVDVLCQEMRKIVA